MILVYNIGNTSSPSVLMRYGGGSSETKGIRLYVVHAHSMAVVTFIPLNYLERRIEVTTRSSFDAVMYCTVLPQYYYHKSVAATTTTTTATTTPTTTITTTTTTTALTATTNVIAADSFLGLITGVVRTTPEERLDVVNNSSVIMGYVEMLR